MAASHRAPDTGKFARLTENLGGKFYFILMDLHLRSHCGYWLPYWPGSLEIPSCPDS